MKLTTIVTFLIIQILIIIFFTCINVEVAEAQSALVNMQEESEFSFYEKQNAPGILLVCNPFDLPLDLIPLVDEDPYCWESYYGGSPETGPSYSTGIDWDQIISFGPEPSYHITLDQSGINDWSFSPVIQIPDDQTEVLFKFRMYLHDPSNPLNLGTAGNLGADDQVELLITNDAGESFESLASWSDTTQFDGAWEEYKIQLTEYAGQEIQFVFWATDGDAPEDTVVNQAFFANFHVRRTPHCPTPSDLSVSSITNSSAQINWTPSDTASISVVQYGPEGFNPDSLEGELFSTSETQNISITDLSAESVYHVYLKAECENSFDSEWIGPLEISTNCSYENANVLFCEGFETGVPGSMTNVYLENFGTWSGLASSNPPGFFPYDGLLSAKYGYPEGYVTALVSPTFNGEGDGTLQLSFNHTNKINYASEASTLTIEVSSDDGASWLPVDSLNEMMVYKWDLAIYNLNDFVTPSASMKIRFIPSGGSLLGLDNIFVIRTGCIESDDISIDDADYNSVEMYYQPEEDFNWSLKYGLEGFDPTADSGTTLNSLPANSVILENLEPNTNYSAYYQDNCEGEESDTWSGPINFSTLCEPVSIGFTENFEESYPPCWREGVDGSLNSGPEHFKPSGWHHSSSNGHAQQISLSDYEEKDNWLVSPFINLSGGDYQVEFHLEVLRTFIYEEKRIPEGDTLQFLISLEGSDNWISLGQVDHTYISPTGGEIISVDLSEYAESTLEFAFRIKTDDFDDPEVSLCKFKLFNFEIANVPTCPNPEELSLNNYTDSTAAFSWVSTGEETQWNVRYGTPGFEPTEGAGTLVEVSDEPLVELSGLSPQTSYEVYVQAGCVEDVDLSEWIGPINFQTSCQAIAPDYLEDFGNGPEAQFPDCWQQATGTAQFPTNWGESDWDLASLNIYDIDANTLFLNYNNFNKVNWAITPPFHLSAESLYQVDAIILFSDLDGIYHSPFHLTGENRLKLIISSDNGITWETIREWNNSYHSQHGAETLNFDLTAYQGDTVRFAFVAEENSGGPTQLRIDDFHVHELGCLAPTSLQTSSIEWNSAEVSWMPEGDETSWNVQVGPEGFDPNLNEGTTYTTETNTGFSITNLEADTDYQVYVQAVCETGVDVSPWLNNSYFSTPISCPPPSNLMLESATEDHMVVSWTAGGEETSWQVLVGSGYFDPDDADASYQTVEVSSNSNALIEPTYYEYELHSIYVRAVCDWNGEEVSETSLRIDAAINYPALPPDYLNDFQGEPVSVFQYWRQADWGTTTEGPTDYMETGVPWHLGHYNLDEPLEKSLKMPMHGTEDGAKEDWLMSPVFELNSETEYTVEFDMAIVEIVDFTDSTAGSLTIFDDFLFLITEDYGATWDTLGNWNNAYNSPYGGEHLTFTLDEYAGSNVQFAFWAHRSFAGASDDIIVYIDDFELGETPYCLSPSDLTASNITANSAEISWTDYNATEHWTIRYGEPGIDPEALEGELVYANSNNDFELTFLEDTTDYDVYVRSSCTEDDIVSDWVGPLSFTTTYEVGLTDMPWEDGFIDLEIPDLPDGWSVGDENDDGTTWQSDDQFRMTGATGLYISGSPDHPMDDWLFTPQLQLDEDLNYVLSFYYQGGGEGLEENLEVLHGGMAEAEGMEIELVDLTGISNTEYQLAIVNFSVDEDGLYFIGFHGYSDTGSGYIAIDDVRLAVCMANAEFSYETDTLCTADNVILPATVEMTGGVFSAPADLDLDPETGEIDPTNSELGSYDVQYFVEIDSLCFANEVVTVIIDACAGVDENFNTSSIKIYPNPAESEIHLDLRNISFSNTIELELVDVAGKVLRSKKVEEPSDVILDILAVNSGLYLIRVMSGNEIFTKRIVVQK